MKANSALSSDWKPHALWWDDVPLRPSEADLVSEVDVAIVGSGYCGLTAARVLAGSGARVIVFDAAEPGYGASTRNHGMIAGGLKLPGDLHHRVGAELAQQIRREAVQSFDDFRALIQREQLEVDFEMNGRFTGAHTPAALTGLERRAAELRSNFGYNAKVVSRPEQGSYIGSEYYYGGLVLEQSGAVHPAKLYAAFRKLAEDRQVPIVGNAEVYDVSGQPGHFTVSTRKGKIKAKHVFLATNAYTGAFNKRLSPYLRRRTVPVTAYMVATEKLSPDLAASILPGNHSGGDTKRSLYAYRLSPDRRRLVFAARAKFRDIPEVEAAPILHRFMREVWPQLRGTTITHSWKGLVCFTFDDLPHLGVADGIHYAAGCQGNGVVMMTYMGEQAARKIISGSKKQCGLDMERFASRPLYSGDPWFLPAVGGYYKARDAVDRYMVAKSA